MVKKLNEVSLVDFSYAEEYFVNHPDAMKTASKINGFSFIKLDGTVYAVQPVGGRENIMLGQGVYGKVKAVANKNGDLFAVKIERIPSRKVKNKNDKQKENPAVDDFDVEYEILTSLERLIAKGYRDAKQVKQVRSHNYIPKQYTVMPLIQGHNLRQILMDSTAPFDLFDYAIKCAEQIQNLHQKRFLHCDIKPSNFMVDRDDNIYLIDFGLSKKIPDESEVSRAKYVGSEGYQAPELLLPDKKVEFSFASDNYAFGQMLIKDFKINFPEEFKMRIQSFLKHLRPSLEEIIAILKELKSNHALNVQKVINLSDNNQLKDDLYKLEVHYENKYQNKEELTCTSKQIDSKAQLGIFLNHMLVKLANIQDVNNFRREQEIEEIQKMFLSLIELGKQEDNYRDSHLTKFLKKWSDIIDFSPILNAEHKHTSKNMPK